MLRAPNHLAADFRPVDARVQLLVHQPAHHHIVASHQVQAVRLLGRGLVVALLADDPLHCVLQHQVGHLIAGDEGAGQGAPVDGYDEDFL